MSRNVGEVSQTLVINPATLPAAGSTLKELTVGQIAAFDASTNLSVNGAISGAMFLGVGLTHDGTSATDAVKTRQFHLKNVVSAQFRLYTPAVGSVFEILFSKPDCNTEYQLKVRFRGGSTMARQGARELIKSYTVVTSCCADCSACASGNCNELAVLQAREIASDRDNLFTVKLISADDATDYGDEVDDANDIDPFDQAAIDTFIAANSGEEASCLGIRLYGNIEACNAYCGIIENGGLNMLNALPTAAITSIVGALGYEDCNSSTISLVRDTVYAQVSSKDLAMMDYHDQGWESGPYRQTASGITLGGNRTVGYRPDSVCPGYHSYIVSFDTDNYEGWRSSKNQPNTFAILIPGAFSDAGITAVLTRLDAIFSTSTVAEYAAGTLANSGIQDSQGPIDADADDTAGAGA